MSQKNLQRPADGIDRPAQDVPSCELVSQQPAPSPSVNLANVLTSRNGREAIIPILASLFQFLNGADVDNLIEAFPFLREALRHKWALSHPSAARTVSQCRFTRDRVLKTFCGRKAQRSRTSERLAISLATSRSPNGNAGVRRSAIPTTTATTSGSAFTASDVPGSATTGAPGPPATTSV
jgi:hypothetical protein